jgi:peptide methionine sulfoxide reductase MsrA
VQAEAAAESKARTQARIGRPIATEITPASTFWPAEEYHQQYLVKNGRATCRI